MSDEYELALPFICVVSEGGPYDDVSFTAGFQLGQIDARLSIAEQASGPMVLTECVLGASVRQLDLIAMHHGFTTEVMGEPTAIEGNLASGELTDWAWVAISRGAKE